MTRPIIAIALLLHTVAFSQWHQRKAERLYHAMQYADAAKWFMLSANENAQSLSKLADCYYRLNDSQNAEKTFARIVQSGSALPVEILRYAQVLHQNARYPEAQQQYQAYLKVLATDRRSSKNAEGLSSMADFYSDSANITVQPKIATDNEEFGPAYYQNGLVFVSDKPVRVKRHIFGWNTRPYLDVYAENGATGNSLFRDVNSVYHEGPMVFFASGTKMIFTRSNYHQKKFKTDKAGVNRLKLYWANLQDGQWTNIEPLPINNDEYSVGHPAMSPDEKTLYFVSDMPGGHGETDIWKVTIENGTYGLPVNLGPGINTEGREMFPFMDANGHLFLASDGHGGLGGLDIFYAENAAGELLDPVNVGAPINTSRDDFGLITDATDMNGYFASFRNGDKNRDDIFSFSSRKPLIKKYLLNGVVKDFNTGNVLENATVTLVDSKGKELTATTSAEGTFSFAVKPKESYTIKGEKIEFKPYTVQLSTAHASPGKAISTEVLLEKMAAYALVCKVTDNKTQAALDSVQIQIVDKKSGTAIIDGYTGLEGILRQALENVKRGDVANYGIAIHRKGYLSKTTTFGVAYDAPGDFLVHQAIDISLSPVEKGTDIGKLLHVNPIYFDLGKAIIRADAAKELDKIVKVMLENPGMTIELGSHTDSRGSDAMNLSLSDKRAKASAAYIVSKGIEARRIVGKGYGESKLVNKCGNGAKCSEGDHQLNRRTEFIVTSF